MKLKPKITIIDYFKDLKDPRIERTKRHKLIDIITITICAVIAGADGWSGIELFGKAKYKWFKKFLELPNGIPSHDTFSRVFSLIDPQQLQQCFLGWIDSISRITFGEVIAIDGKTLRHSYDRSNDKADSPHLKRLQMSRANQAAAIHMVSAWSATNGLVLGQLKVDSKSNEITAIPKLLQILSLNGALVTIDAMGCQKKIVQNIIDKDADYLITLKKNQGGLYERVEKLFKPLILNNLTEIEKTEYRQSEVGNGREETRFYQVINNVSNLVDQNNEWANLNSVIMVDYLRTEISTDKTTLERRYFISSRNNKAKEFAVNIREHWTIENQMNWVLDVSFKEDDSRIRKDNSPENLAVIRHISLNLLKQEKSLKVGVKNKRNNAGWDEKYLLKILTN